MFLVINVEGIMPMLRRNRCIWILCFNLLRGASGYLSRGAAFFIFWGSWRKLSGNDFTFRSSKGTAALLDESVAWKLSDESLIVCDCLLVICGSFNFRASVIVVPVKLIHIVAVVTYGVVVIRFETLTVEEMEENLSKCCERNDRIQIKDIYSDRLLTIRKSIAEIKKQLGILWFLYIGAVSKWLKQAMRGSAIFSIILGEMQTECRKKQHSRYCFQRSF